LLKPRGGCGDDSFNSKPHRARGPLNSRLASRVGLEAMLGGLFLRADLLTYNHLHPEMRSTGFHS